jgi:hypothetical protein
MSAVQVPAQPERSPQEWFQEAARCYLEQHQGCPWCGSAHCVHYRREGSRIIYICNRCDFRATYEETTGRYVVIPGEKRSSGKPPDTMFEI